MPCYMCRVVVLLINKTGFFEAMFTRVQTFLKEHTTLLHKSAFCSHETNESDQQNRIVLKHSLDRFKAPSTQIQIKICGSKISRFLCTWPDMLAWDQALWWRKGKNTGWNRKNIFRWAKWPERWSGEGKP